MSNPLRALAVLSLALLSGCVSVTASRLESGPARAPISPDQVTIYRTEAQVTGKYVEVAMLNGLGHYNATNESQLFNEMRRVAAKQGANGVILGAVEEPTTGQKVANALLGTPANRRPNAVTIFVERP